MRRLASLWMIVAISILLAPNVAQADELRPGYLELTEQSEGQWQLVWKQPVTTAPSATPPAPQIPANCSFLKDPEIGTAAAAIVGSAQLQCTGSLAGYEVGMPGLLGQSEMLVRLQPIGGDIQALRLTAREPTVTIASPEGPQQVWRTYFILGVEHILAGWDHLLFVIALVLLIRNWRMVAVAATAFTLSHSITLAGAALGFVGLPQAPVEALIALSIVFLALEVVKYTPDQRTLTRQYPWVVAFLFGLLHGFGFAGALTSIGLPQDDIAAALLAFNLGVECGQLMVIAALLCLIAILQKLRESWLGPAIRIAAYGIGIIGSYWLLERTIFSTLS